MRTQPSYLHTSKAWETIHLFSQENTNTNTNRSGEEKAYKELISLFLYFVPLPVFIFLTMSLCPYDTI